MNTRRITYLIIVFFLTATLTASTSLTAKAQPDASAVSEKIVFVGKVRLFGVNIVRVAGNYAYIGEGNKIRIVDVTNPTDPVEIWRQDFPSLYALETFGNKLYLGSGDGFFIYDITNPISPTYVSDYPPGSTFMIVSNVSISGTYAYISTFVPGYNRLLILDISNPITPTQVGILDYPSELHQNQIEGISVAGNFAYLSNGPGGLRIVDVSNPASPQEIGYYEIIGWTANTVVHGNYAFVTGNGTVIILDVTNPSNPILVNESMRGGYYIRISGNYAYFAKDGMKVYDIANVFNPREVGYYRDIDQTVWTNFNFDVADEYTPLPQVCN